jgi:sodium/hydrogen exchanger-like protein 6/7/sodium/hydrogen exchanger 8
MVAVGDTLTGAALFVVILVGKSIKDRSLAWPHETSVGLLAGTVVGLVMGGLVGFDVVLSQDQAKQLFLFNQSWFFNFVLPPIIFCAGYTLKKRRFLKNIALITLYGFVGTFSAFIVLACLISLVNKHFIQYGSYTAFSDQQVWELAAILCSTDTVAALSLLDPAMYEALYFTAFGEGIVNDAVSIVLYQGVTEVGFSGTTDTIRTLLLVCLKTFTLSALLGLFNGLVASYVLKRAQMKR